MLISFIRAAILYILIIFFLRLSGKKQVSQLETNELVFSLIVADLAAVPMSEIGIPLIYGIVPIVSVYICERLISFALLKGQFAQKIIEGKPSILIENGIINEHELRACNFTVNNLLEQLRLKNYININQIAFAILETCGQVSVIPIDFNKNDNQIPRLPLSLIIDGEICKGNMDKHNISSSWLNEKLKEHDALYSSVFFAYLDTNNKFHFQLKEDTHA